MSVDPYKAGQQFFEDIAKMASGALGTADAARQEFEGLVKARMEKFFRDAQLVTRDEFAAVQEMASLARQQQVILEARIAALEAQLANIANTSKNPKS